MARVADALLEGAVAAQLEARRAPRRLGREPLALLLLGQEVERRLDLAVELALGRAAARQVAQQAREAREERHRRTGS